MKKLPYIFRLSNDEGGYAIVIGILLLMLSMIFTMTFLDLVRVSSSMSQSHSDHTRSLFVAEAGVQEVFSRLGCRKDSQITVNGSTIYPYIPVFATVNDRGTATPVDDLYWRNDTVDNNLNGLIDEWGEVDPRWMANIWFATASTLPSQPADNAQSKYEYYPTILEIRSGNMEELLEYSSPMIDDFSLKMHYKKFPNGKVAFIGETGELFEQPTACDQMGSPIIVIESNGKRGDMRRRVRVEAFPRVRSMSGYGLCGCDWVHIIGDSSTDSFNSNLGPYPAGLGNNGNVGSNGYIQLTGGADIGGSEIAGDYIDNGQGTVVGNAEAGGTVTRGEVQGNIFQNVSPRPQPCPCDELRLDVEMDYFEYNNDNHRIGMTDAGHSPFRGAGYDLNLVATDNLTLYEGTYYFDSITIHGQATLSTVGKVTIYVRGDADLSGGGVINTSMIPSNLSVYVLGSNINIGGTYDWYGTVYAPYADVDLAGTAEFYGAVLGKTIEKNGTPGFHYDERLSEESRKFFGEMRVYSWEEIE